MTTSGLQENPALTFALALAAGMVAQAAARHLRIPGIVLLLATGVLLGPDVLGLIHPQTLGGTLHTLVGFAVAIILFEGGLNLEFKRIRQQASSIRRLISVGAVITTLGGSLAAHLLLGWDWIPSVLFGTLVIVTGPTVINPLLRRLRIQRKVATVLEAEGVLIDAIGAVVAVVALEVVLSPAGSTLVHTSLDVLTRLGLGTLMGAAGGLLVGSILRVHRLLPEGLENVFTLSMVLALFQISEALVPETGIVSVTAAGVLVGNSKTPALRDLREFKEQLTVLFIALLFVLLAADVRLGEVAQMGWAGGATVLALMLLVRPLNVLVSTAGSDLTTRERLFLSWMAPRGIVAAAVSSLFAERLAAAGIAGGHELRALVFLVIAVTVLVQGLSGAAVAQFLRVRRPSDSGYTILGASELSLCIGELLREAEQEVLFLDSNPALCRTAENRGFRVLYGNALSESLLQRAELDGRAGCLSTTSNDGVNLVFAKKAREEYKVPRAWVALRRGHTSVTPEALADNRVHVLFGAPRRLDLWSLRLERKQASTEEWVLTDGETVEPTALSGAEDGPDQLFLPLIVRRGKKILIMDESVRTEKDDHLIALVYLEKQEEAARWLREHGWIPAGEVAAEPEEKTRVS